MTATGLEESVPKGELPRTAPTLIVELAPSARTLTVSPGSAPVAAATLAGSSSPPWKRNPPGPKLRVPRLPSLAACAVTPISCTAARPCGPTTATFSRSTGAATRTPGSEPLAVARRWSNPSGERLAICSRAEPTTWWTSSSAEPVRLVLATSTPSTSATPTAMPLPASSSCTAWERSRTRYRCTSMLIRTPAIRGFRAGVTRGSARAPARSRRSAARL